MEEIETLNTSLNENIETLDTNPATSNKISIKSL